MSRLAEIGARRKDYPEYPTAGTVKNDNWPFNDRKPYSIWFKNRYRAFACGDGIFIRDFQ
jgi:hypothetical protein